MLQNVLRKSFTVPKDPGTYLGMVRPFAGEAESRRQPFETLRASKGPVLLTSTQPRCPTSASRGRDSPDGAWLSGGLVGKHFSACRPRPATSSVMSGWRRTAIYHASSPRYPSIAPEH